MCKLYIKGGRELFGSVRVQGSKNAVLPVLAATVLCDGVSIIHDCPTLRDVNAAIKILELIGCSTKREGKTLYVDSANVNCCCLPDELMRQMRSSIFFLGAITSRCKKAKMCSPGGCELGPRPIDLHIKALRELGIQVTDIGGCTKTVADKITGADIVLDFPSVGATENIILASVFCEGTTRIINAAKEPEINDLQCFINKMGGRVSGAGTDTVIIEGVKKLRGAEHRVQGDRIVAATYLCAGAVCGGDIEITNADSAAMDAVISVIKNTGADIVSGNDYIRLRSDGKIRPVDILRTMPYPGFPTDVQAPLTSVLAVADGTSVVVENIFENRFKHCAELGKMGADIKISGRAAVIRGVKELCGANVTAMELRGGDSLCVAAAAAKGESTVSGMEYIERGYENIADDLAMLGADAKLL